ncbi:class I SAM-dependent methyltransferase [Siccirubricoccus sp. KC 17139]|uniref:Class I SAM-dependent methyltransferase n=1 Tax=Siccirubricoccus soli TaxID=2899147 RepID=A0ABT1D103_9PROT|nr:class I SAM-dependent methyltransferase [Siccirubricoccus soli]MCO6415591.1 class I SAM-dependent methyltransferase [Siccirubricoccus soli]MCP2681723.1 class I SAM-dependent methyltransferase [Siccirubricoccus soli]
MDAAEDGMWWYRSLHGQVLDTLAAVGPPRGWLLDAGCGTGGFLARLTAARPGQPALGLEYFPAAAARAAAKSGAPVATGSVNALPFADASIATLVSLDVLCHAAVDPARALAEFRRVLAPGGRLVLNLPAFAWLHSAHDLRVHNARRYTAAEARAMLEAAGFTAIRSHYWNALLLPLMVLQRKVLARAPNHGSDVAPFPPWLDRMLLAVTGLERRLQRLGLRFPAGGSILLTATPGPAMPKASAARPAREPAATTP